MADYQLTPEEQTKINNAVEEIVGSLVREDGEKQLRKDITARMKEEINFTPAELNALARERFDSKATENVEKFQGIIDLNELLIANCKTTTTSPDSDED